MSDVSREQIEDEIVNFEISGEELESIGVTNSGAGYTQFAYCTQFSCPGFEGA